MKNKKDSLRRAFCAAFPHTLPILTGFLFLGATYGIYMNTAGFPFYYPMLTSLLVFAGSMEFLAVGLLLGAFDPLSAFLLALVIGARHIFYGISMLDTYRGLGRKKVYLIFGLCDETFSLARTVEPPADVDRGLFYLCITLLNQSYWVLGASLGGIFGSFIPFHTEGLDFCMTALFVVIFLEQLRGEKQHTVSLLGLLLSLGCLLLFGADGFLIPAMLVIALVLLLLRRPLSKGGDDA